MQFQPSELKSDYLKMDYVEFSIENTNSTDFYKKAYRSI